MSEPLLRVEKLKKHFPIQKGIVFPKTIAFVKAVDGIDFSVYPGETFALVGESGCGKSTTGMLILKLMEPTAGSIWFNGSDIAHLAGDKLTEYHQSVQLIFQDPFSSLDPRMRVRTILAEPLAVNSDVDNRAKSERVKAAIQWVRLEEKGLDLYPHEFSGGQRQRIALARALISRPKLVVLDEPVSALDVSIRSQVMNDMKDLQQQLGMAYLLIAHGLDTVRYMAHTMGVMYLGRIVERGPCEEIFTNPRHPYTQALFSAALPSHPDHVRKEIVLSGEVPSPVNIPSGCRFHPRCFCAYDYCSQKDPPVADLGDGHFVACYRTA